MATRIFGAIDVGSYELNLSIYEFNQDSMKVIDSIKYRLDLGPICVTIKKSRMSGVKYYNSDNQVMDEEQLQKIYAWMDTCPVMVGFERENASLEDNFNDSLFNFEIEQYISEGKFQYVIDLIKNYCTENKGGVKVIFKSYIRNNYDYEAVGYVFSFENEAMILRRAVFDDNDIEKRIIALKKVGSREFLEFCDTKYNSDYFLIQNKKKQVLMNQ